MAAGDAAAQAPEDPLNLHTVIVSYQRLALLKQTVASYRHTVTVPHRLVVVDNGSGRDVRRWLDSEFPPEDLVILGENRYPGYACNRGFELAAADITHLHRSDNDMLYLAGWCDAARERFEDPAVGIVGLRTDEEELHTELNTGGTAIIRKLLWQGGLRYNEKPWDSDMTEDWELCRDAVKMGWEWTRVTRPAVIHLGAEHASADDPYYQRSFGDRKIRWMLDA